MILFDTHLHLSPEIDRADFFAAARLRGVGLFLVAGTSIQDGDFVSSLADPEAGIYIATGVHPHNAAQFQAQDLARFRDWLALPGAVAVGEVGLDFYYQHSPRLQQERVFANFLELAAELDKAVVIHCREAFAPCHKLVKDYFPRELPFVVHSFTGSVPEAEKWLDLGAYLSFNGMVTFKKADNIRTALAAVPLERLLLETDSPYLAPVPHRGKTNTSAYLPEIAARVAQELQLENEELAKLTTENACQLFSITLT
jgi:TatD DNase family protein